MGQKPVVALSVTDMSCVLDIIQLCMIQVCLLMTGVLIIENQYLFRHSLDESM